MATTPKSSGSRPANSPSSSEAARPKKSARTEAGEGDEYLRAKELLLSGRTELALKIAERHGANDPAMRNLRGVCLLRMGRPADAMPVFRSLVIQAGAICMRPEVPVIYKTNFATALLLMGNVSGSQNALGEIDRESHPSVRRLREAIAAWKRSLPLLQRLNWIFGGTPSMPVTVDFPPGEVDDPVPDAAPRPA